jgi:Fe-S cluster biogenesis protein NfuA
MREKVEKALDEIRSSLQADGGDVKLVGIKGKIVEVKLQGACSGCPMSAITLKEGIELAIKEAVPEVEAVVAV